MLRNVTLFTMWGTESHTIPHSRLLCVLTSCIFVSYVNQAHVDSRLVPRFMVPRHGIVVLCSTKCFGTTSEREMQCQEWQPERVSVEAKKYYISIKVSGRVFAYLGPRRNSFMVDTNDAEGKWTGYRINSESALEDVIPLVRANFDKIDGGQTAHHSG